MGRELQKKKNKSGLHKVRRKAKKTSKPLLANAIIAAHWDRSQTLTQNYARLGLTSKINAPTGGREDSTLNSSLSARTQGKLSISNKPTQFVSREVRIERDPKSGAIVRVLDDISSHGAVGKEAGNQGPWKALSDPLDELDGMVSSPKEKRFENDGEKTTTIIQDLEAQAARPAGKDTRRQSERERIFLKRLIDKYGVDEEAGCFGRMARDGSLNVMQQSAGDLRKRIRRYVVEEKGV